VRIGQTAGGTDTGRKRRHNEDAYVCEPPLFAIADGMGGAQAGEVASQLAAAALTESTPAGGGEQRVAQLIQEANRRVHHRASIDAATTGMGTTMTVALVAEDGRVAFGHVGDSRAYLLRDAQLEQLTDDHTLVAELVRRGELSPADAELHPQRSVITRALGTDPDVDVDTFSVQGRDGDVFLLCSDGLSSMVDEETIERIVEHSRGDLATATRELIHAANRGGGEDNITAILFDLQPGEPVAAMAPDAPTREQVTAPPDEEETLHPEDGVAPPAPAPTAPPSLSDTVVVPAEQIRALAGQVAPETPQAGLGRRLLALAVIIALIAIIVVLVWWGLAR
jgi:PPM family protein phosphatase